MAYKKQTWVDLETPLDAEHMNHIEDGIGSLSEENATLTDELYTQFKAKGEIVKCKPREGCELHVINEVPVRQEGKGTPSPDNVRPFGFYNSIELKQSGINLLKGVDFANSLANETGSNIDEANGIVRYAPGEQGLRDIYTNFEPNTVYTIIARCMRVVDGYYDTNLRVVYDDGSKIAINSLNNNANEYVDVVFVTNAAKSVVKFETGYYINQVFYDYNHVGIFKGVLSSDIFEPFSFEPRDYVAHLHAPMVSGEIDWKTRLAKTDKRYFVLNGTEEWTFFNTNSNGSSFYTPIPFTPNNKRFLCTHFVDDYAANIQEVVEGLFITTALNAVYIRIAASRNITTVEQFKAWLANESNNGNAVTVVVDAPAELIEFEAPTITAYPYTNVISANVGITSVSGQGESKLELIEERNSQMKKDNKQTGNVSIVCAKEFAYSDGTPPQIDYFLLEESGTYKFYISKDLASKEFAFEFVGDPSLYTFGILQNGDIIAVRFAETLTGSGKDDNNRVNPYVFLASEKWMIQHEVDFGEAIKPCGWLSNCGFRVLPDGTCLFCEYTRLTTATANVWRITGDPSDPANWAVVKSFPITSTDNLTGFKHIHTVQYDHFTGVSYFATGDDNVGAMVFYSTDNGLTWTQLITPDSNNAQDEHGWYGGSEKYCRLLNFTFTEDFIYWGSDTSTSGKHYLFKAARDENGLLDYSTVEDYVQLSTQPTYGTAYLPELDAIFLFSRADGAVDNISVDVVDLTDGQVKTVSMLYAVHASNRCLGFRTRFSEWYPHDSLIRVGFCLYSTGVSNATNQNKGFGNSGYKNLPSDNVNNLKMQFRKVDGEFKVQFGTYYV